VGGGSSFTLYLPETFASLSEEPEAHIVVDDRSIPKTNFTTRALRRSVRRLCRARGAFDEELADDREGIQLDDRVILIVEDDPQFAKVLLDMAREKGFKAVVALAGTAALPSRTDCAPMRSCSISICRSWMG